jgi:eukaryotic-like serine/threonine-protein kinase
MGDDFVIGQRLGDYEILGQLGAGGMGKVYKVRNVISERVEAMKILLPNLAGQKDLADRFLREIKLLATLDHPNIAALRNALTLDNQLVMIMEYVEGSTLSSRLLQGPIPAADAVNYSEQLLSALSYAHHLNVIHRDVKPANMMLTPQGVVKLMDFGIARPNNDAGMTVTGTTLGSLNYMSPEQVRGEPVDPRSDLYSMGVSLYEMVTGQLPFRGHSNYSVMSAHLQEPPPPPITVRPDLPAGLNDIILMAMAKAPQSRFGSAEAFANALRSVMPGVGPTVSATPVPTVRMPTPGTAASGPAAMAAGSGATLPHPAPPPSSRRGLYMALGGVIVVCVLAAAAYYLPRRIKTQASDSSTTAPAATMPMASAPAAMPAAPPPGATPPTVTGTIPSVPAPVKPQESASQKAQEAAAAQAQLEAQRAAEQAAEQEAQRKAAELAEAEKESDQVNSRAAAVSSSLDTLQRQQSAQGYGLRGDMVAAEELMKTDLSRAQSALAEQDGAKAKQFLDAADLQVSKIERFLGR